MQSWVSEMDPSDQNSGSSSPELLGMPEDMASPDPSGSTATVRGSASRDLGFLAVVVGFGNAALVGLFLMSFAGTVLGGTNSEAAPTLKSPSTPVATANLLESSVPDGFRMVCFSSNDPHGVIRSAPAFFAPPAGFVPKGGLVKIVGGKSGLGFVRVRYNTRNGKRIEGWMHKDILSSTPCR